MKKLWNNFKVAFAMYSKIPMPRADWNKENMKYTFCFFPFIGLVIGALVYLAGYLGNKFSFHSAFVSMALVLIPSACNRRHTRRRTSGHLRCIKLLAGKRKTP